MYASHFMWHKKQNPIKITDSEESGQFKKLTGGVQLS